jgi:hypothetical protein
MFFFENSLWYLPIRVEVTPYEIYPNSKLSSDFDEKNCICIGIFTPLTVYRCIAALITGCYLSEESFLSLICLHSRDTRGGTEVRAQVRPIFSIFEQ